MQLYSRARRSGQKRSQVISVLFFGIVPDLAYESLTLKKWPEYFHRNIRQWREFCLMIYDGLCFGIQDEPVEKSCSYR